MPQSVVAYTLSTELERTVAGLMLPPEWRVRIELRRRKTLGIEVSAGGTVTLAVPEDAAPNDIERLLERHVDRIARAVARHRGVEPTHPAKELIDGEHFDYLGRTYRLRIATDTVPTLQIVGDWLELAAGQGSKPTATHLVHWYTDQGDQLIAEIMPALARAAGLSVPATRIRDLGARWGVRERDNRISIHWATFQLPEDLVELVLAHELTHLRVNAHSAAFWRELSKLVPDFVSRERRLAQLGSTAWLGAIR
ncbi:M48 family metallopeptidase [Nocardia jiangxiensis]|uniref:M48 family metallopeptidase n=1 Tax=Nocardia jiangxiensis TaxID=282685 RepID=UPI0002F12CA3|nr:YgjP-like metallopeptidase domain-containing protein [Nocardia jiangxiensis]